MKKMSRNYSLDLNFNLKRVIMSKIQATQQSIKAVAVAQPTIAVVADALLFFDFLIISNSK